MKVQYLLLGCLMMASCTQKSPISSDKYTRLGVQQAAALWTEQDGSQADFDALVETYYCQTDSERYVLFE